MQMSYFYSTILFFFSFRASTVFWIGHTIFLYSNYILKYELSMGAETSSAKYSAPCKQYRHVNVHITPNRLPYCTLQCDIWQRQMANLLTPKPKTTWPTALQNCSRTANEFECGPTAANNVAFAGANWAVISSEHALCCATTRKV